MLKLALFFVKNAYRNKIPAIADGIHEPFSDLKIYD